MKDSVLSITHLQTGTAIEVYKTQLPNLHRDEELAQVDPLLHAKVQIFSAGLDPDDPQAVRRHSLL